MLGSLKKPDSLAQLWSIDKPLPKGWIDSHIFYQYYRGKMYVSRTGRLFTHYGMKNLYPAQLRGDEYIIAKTRLALEGGNIIVAANYFYGINIPYRLMDLELNDAIRLVDEMCN
jgi:hypothetical protein